MKNAASSRKNLVSVAVVASIFIAIVVAGVIGNVRSGNYVVLPIVFTAFAICGLAIWISHFRVRVLLRDRTPDRIIAHYHRSVRRIPNADAAAAYLSALAAAFFGDFHRARRELAGVEWGNVPASYQGHRLYVLAILAILEENDHPKALELSSEARQFDRIQLLEDVIHVVAGQPTPEMTERLERAARKQQGLIPGMCAWALALHYKRTNQPDLAADFKELLRLAVPYSVPLLPRGNIDGPDASVA